MDINVYQSIADEKPNRRMSFLISQFLNRFLGLRYSRYLIRAD